jgi:hypothetical protein
MAKKDPAFLFYDGDAAIDVSHMNRLERGAYFDLIQAQRKFGGYTVEQARKILGKDFVDVWPALELILSKTEEDVYYIEWIKLSMEDRKVYKEKQRKRIQDYWDGVKKQEAGQSQENDSDFIPRNNHGITTDIPLVNEDEDVIIDNNKDLSNKGGVGEKVKTWRDDFSIYKSELDVVYNALIVDQKFIKEREEFNPNLDIVLSLKKAYTDFWSKEKGWKYKKRQRTKDIDWTATLTNAIELNKVYKPRQRQSYGTDKASVDELESLIITDKKQTVEEYGDI